MNGQALVNSRALWNRRALDLRSDEVLAQILDRGELAAWRELYALTKEDAELRARIRAIVATVPLATTHFWRAALVGLGEVVEWDQPSQSAGEL